jgi:ketosteroid isomerase-like protein
MRKNEEIVKQFYTAFQKLDHAGMNACYSDEISFFDPAFGLLKGVEAKAMWRMLCTRAQDFSLTFDTIQTVDDEYYTCNWVASYIFSKTGRKVVNRIKAHMRILDGKIVEHSDGFSLSKWSAQALGPVGVFLGWTSFVQNKVRREARKNLEAFMQAGGQ